MKIVIVSDTHGELSSLQKVHIAEDPADLYLHAGDVEAPSSSIWPFLAVKGNCDGYCDDYPARRTFETPFGKLQIEHYPLYSHAEAKTLYENGIRIFVHGHTHVREEIELEGVKVLCPGSLSFPEDSPVGTYLVLQVDEKAVVARFKEV